MNPITRYILKLLFIILLQVIVLKEMELGAANWWITPFVYFIIILDLPLKINPLLSMLVAFSLGIVIDMFYNTFGMHASACVFLAFLRHYFVILLLPRDGFDMNTTFTIKNVGFLKYLFYIGILSISYHLWFFIFERFSFDFFLLRLSQALTSGIFAVFLIILLHLVFVKTQKN